MLETMVSTVVLAVLAVGGSAAMRYAGSIMARQQARREALVEASAIMERNIYDIGLVSLKNRIGFDVASRQLSATTYLEKQDIGGELHLLVRVTVPVREEDPVVITFLGNAEG